MKTISLVKIVLLTFIISVYSTVNIKAQSNPESSANFKFEIKEIPSSKAVVIKSTIPSSEIGTKMGELYGKLFGYLGQQNIQPAGAPFAVYYNYDPNGNTTFEVGVPINTIANSAEEIKYKEFPAMKVVSTLYTGAYEKIAPTYTAMEKHMKDNKLQSKNVSWEVYLTDPTTVKDPNEYKTLIYFPIK